MTENEIQQEYKSNTLLISRGRLLEAFDNLIRQSSVAGFHDLADRAESSRTAYSYMLRYFADNLEDPSRAAMYDGLVLQARSLADLLYRRLMLPASSRLYYSTMRMQQMQPKQSIAELVATYDAARQDDMIALFNAVWTAFPLSQEDADALRAVISDAMYGSVVAEQITHAVTLGLLEFYDETRFDLLISAAESAETGVAAAAMIGIVAALSRFRKRRHSAHVVEALTALADRPEMVRNAQAVMMEFTRSLGTADLNRRIQEDVMPDMMRISGEIFSKMRRSQQDNNADPDGDFMPPDMSEFIENSEITGHLRDFNERQCEGDDVYLTTFAHMKSFPFFREAANWFLPYSDTVHALRDAFGNDQTTAGIMKTLGRMAVLCDSDKYSMAFTVAMMPTEQRSMVFNQISHVVSEQDVDLSIENLQPESFSSAANRIIKNLYRFYDLFRRKSDFFNLFSYVVNPLDIPVLGRKLQLETIADYMFMQHSYKEALRIYERIEADSTPDARRYRAMGYCMERINDLDRAIEYYQKADLLDSSNVWTLRHLGKIFGLCKRPEEAVAVYERLLVLRPDEASDLVALGKAQLLLGNYDEALLRFYEAEHLTATLALVGKELALALLLTGDYAGAQSYIERTIPISMEPDDYKIEMYIALKRNDIAAAVRYLRMWRDASSSDRDSMLQSIAEDAAKYPPLAVDPDRLALLFDAALS